MPNPRVVTIIPNWNLKKDLGECLDSLQQTRYANHQVVVVDNNSSDGSVEYVRTHHPGVEVVALTENRGYAGALNAGIKYALSQKADYVFALNNDTIVDPEAITHLVKTLQSDPTIGLAAPKTLYSDHPERIYSLGDRISPFMPLPLSIGRKQLDRPAYAGILEFDYVTGTAMCIPTTIIQQVGEFDLSYFMYYEDADYCRRVRQVGYRIVCVGQARVYHKVALSSAHEKPFITRVRARNRVLFYRRYRHGLHPWLTYSTIALVAIWRSLEYLVKGKPELVKPYLEGLVSGWLAPLPVPRYSWTEDSAEPSQHS